MFLGNALTIFIMKSLGHNLSSQQIVFQEIQLPLTAFLISFLVASIACFAVS